MAVELVPIPKENHMDYLAGHLGRVTKPKPVFRCSLCDTPAPSFGIEDGKTAVVVCFTCDIAWAAHHVRIAIGEKGNEHIAAHAKKRRDEIRAELGPECSGQSFRDVFQSTPFRLF